MSARPFAWSYFGKCVGVGALLGAALPAAWFVLKAIASTFDDEGQFLLLLGGVFSLYVVTFPWYFIFGWELVVNHWPYFWFANAMIAGLIWGSVTGSNRR